MKKLLKRKKRSEKQLPSRITNDTVAEHREKVLAGGRKHKYPLQYTKYRVVWNTIILSVVAIIAVIVFIWLQLYVWKSTSDVTYRITRLLPLPVASVDGISVPYSRYLLYHRSTMAFADGQSVAADKLLFQQKQAMDNAIKDAYAQKIANERNLVVTDEQVETLIESKRKESNMTEHAYEGVVRDKLHWSMDELRQAFRAALLNQAVAFSVDQQASDLVKKIEAEVREGKALDQIAEAHKDVVQYMSNVTVPKDNSDGGLSAAAARLKPEVISSATKTLQGDGYYFILLRKSDDQTITYDYIRVPLTMFSQQFEALKKDNKVQYYIKM